MLAAVTAAQFVAPRTASAGACGTVFNHQAGYGTDFWTGSQPLAYEGVSANITDRGGYLLCTTNTNGGQNFSTSWTMVYGHNTAYAQSGTMYRFGYGSCGQRWAEQKQDDAHTFVDFYLGGCSNPGETHRYWQQALFVNGNWHVRSNIDTTVIRESSFSPFSNWTAPFGVGYSAESYFVENNIPGSLAAKQDYSTMQVQAEDDKWYGSCGNVNLGRYNQNSSRWGVDSVSCSHVRTWTN